jgi:hypothetical protein
LIKARKSNSKPKPRKISADLRNKKRQDSADNKIKEESNDVKPNMRKNDIQADVQTEEMKAEKKDNSDIKEVLTNTSAEKSHNSSCVIEDLNETRIKSTYSHTPLDLIEEYRSTIIERYTQRVLDNVEPDSSYTPAFSNYDNYMESKQPIMNEDKHRQTSSLPQSIASSKRTSIDRNCHVIERPTTERKRPKSCKKTTQKKALAQSSSIIVQGRSRQKGNFEGSSTMNRTNRSFTKSSTKRKVNVRKQIDNAAS